MTKLLENIYRAVNIGLVNEMKLVAEKMGIDIWEVIDAASTKPFGFSPFYPGPGGAGTASPLILSTLHGRPRNMAFTPVSSSWRERSTTPCRGHVLERTAEALNARGLALSRSRILVLGISYKKNIDDMRESPAVKLMELIRRSGATLSYHDPYVPAFPKMREHSFDLKSVSLPEAMKNCDCAVLVTDHDTFDYESIRQQAPLLIDTRGRYRSRFPNVVSA